MAFCRYICRSFFSALPAHFFDARNKSNQAWWRPGFLTCSASGRSFSLLPLYFLATKLNCFLSQNGFCRENLPAKNYLDFPFAPLYCYYYFWTRTFPFKIYWWVNVFFQTCSSFVVVNNLSAMICTIEGRRELSRTPYQIFYISRVTKNLHLPLLCTAKTLMLFLLCHVWSGACFGMRRKLSDFWSEKKNIECGPVLSRH